MSVASDIVVVGEALVDIAEAPDEPVRVRPGGSPLNVAVGLGRLGRRVTLLTQLGPDAYGDNLRAHLAAAGVGVVPLEPVTPTGRATVRLDPSGSAAYTFELTWNPDVVPVPTECELLHVGSLATSLLPGADAVLDGVRQAVRRGIPVSVDPNVRPSLTPDLGWVRERFLTLAAQATIVKLSAEDTAALFGEAPAEQVVDALLAAGGPALVALTRGADGALLATARDRVTVTTAAVSVVDTIGAGDAFMAALLAGIDVPALMSGDVGRGQLAYLGALACRAAAITCTRRGADPPWAAELSATPEAAAAAPS